MNESVNNLVRSRVLKLKQQAIAIDESIEHHEECLESLTQQRREILYEFKDLEKALEESTCFKV